MPLLTFDQRVNPLHVLGTHFDSPITCVEAIKEAGMDFRVEAIPHKAEAFGHVIDTKTVDIFREPKEAGGPPIYLGSQGARFRPIQNVDIAATIDATGLLEQGWKVDSVGYTGEGERMFISLVNGITTVGRDELRDTLLFTEGKAGSGALLGAIVPVRLRCLNQLVNAIKNAGLRLAVSHVGDVGRDFRISADIMASLKRSREQILEYFNRMAMTRIVEKQVEEIFRATWTVYPHDKAKVAASLGEDRLAALPEEHQKSLRKGVMVEATERARMETRVQQALEQYAVINADNPALAGTVWHAYQAATELADWRERTPKEAVEESVMFGRRKEEKLRAFDASMKVVWQYGR